MWENSYKESESAFFIQQLLFTFSLKVHFKFPMYHLPAFASFYLSASLSFVRLLFLQHRYSCILHLRCSLLLCQAQRDKVNLWGWGWERESKVMHRCKLMVSRDIWSAAATSVDLCCLSHMKKSVSFKSQCGCTKPIGCKDVYLFLQNKK